MVDWSAFSTQYSIFSFKRLNVQASGFFGKRRGFVLLINLKLLCMAEHLDPLLELIA